MAKKTKKVKPELTPEMKKEKNAFLIKSSLFFFTFVGLILTVSLVMHFVY